jgi:hypothetical protein
VPSPERLAVPDELAARVAAGGLGPHEAAAELLAAVIPETSPPRA